MIKVGSSPLIFALYSSILCFSISCWRKQERVGKHLSSLHLYINCLAWSITKSKTVSVLMSISVPNNTRFCVNFTFNAVSHFSFNIVSSEVQKRLVQAHFQNICSMLSFLSLQKPHWVLAVTPILFNTILVAIILCIMRICNHLSFMSLVFCTFMKTIPRNIWLQFFTPFQATIWHTVVVYKNVVIEPCTNLVHCAQSPSMVILGQSFCMEGIGGAQDSRVLPKKIVVFFVVVFFVYVTVCMFCCFCPFSLAWQVMLLN